MTTSIFLSSLAVVIAFLFFWAFRHLPSEEWQMIASVPTRRTEGGEWLGLNLTYYGFFNATACAFACAYVLLLMATLGVSWYLSFGIVAGGMLIALPAARFIARLIEGKRHTFTVAGASFVLMLLLPWLLSLLNLIGDPTLHVPARPALAAITIGYAFGESIGRLACISFGCCYGKLLVEKHTTLRKFSFVFSGATKKAAYESKLDGVCLIPIQAVTSIIYAGAGLAGSLLFLEAHWTAALIVTLTITQIWRIISEFFRADFRGGRLISAYQIMALAGLVYSIIILSLLPDDWAQAPDLTNGLRVFTDAWSLILLQMIWFAVFLYLGRSSVTGSILRFHVKADRI